MPKMRLRPRTTLEELTALHQTPQLDLRGPTSKGRGRQKSGGGEGKGTERVIPVLLQSSETTV